MRIGKERCERKAYPNRVYPDRNRIRLRVNGALEYKPTQATLLICLSWDALCVPKVVESMSGHSSISYIWSFSLTVSPISNFCT